MAGMQPGPRMATGVNQQTGQGFGQRMQGGPAMAPRPVMNQPQQPQYNRLGQVVGQGNWGPGSQWWANHNQQGGTPQGKPDHAMIGALQQQGQPHRPAVMQPMAGGTGGTGGTGGAGGAGTGGNPGGQGQGQGGTGQGGTTPPPSGAQGTGTVPGTSQIANTLQAQYMPQTPMGKASTLSQQQINALGPQATIAQILKGFQPQARQAQSALNNNLAAAGIVGGGAEGATDLLQGQLASSLAPTLAQAIQGSQGMQLGAETQNMNAQNQMTGQNLQDIMQTNALNQQAANQMRSQLAGYQMQGWQTPLQDYSSLLNAFMGGGIGQGVANNFPVYGNSGPLSFLFG